MRASTAVSARRPASHSPVRSITAGRRRPDRAPRPRGRLDAARSDRQLELGVALPGVARHRARAVLGQHAQLRAGRQAPGARRRRALDAGSASCADPRTTSTVWPISAERHRVAVGVERDQPVVGDDALARASPAGSPAGRPAASAPRLRAAKRSIGRWCVVPCMRRSATSACQATSCSLKSSRSRNARPGRKLRLTYFTPDSTLPLVCARYGRHSRGSKPQ